jgi:PAS domain S-box-containing protein
MRPTNNQKGSPMSPQTAPKPVSSAEPAPSHPTSPQKPRLFNSVIVGGPQAAMDFITNILESSTEYSIIAHDLDGKILLWNEGARRLYGYEPEEAIAGMKMCALFLQEDVQAGLPKKLMDDTLLHGKYEGTVPRRRKNGHTFIARVVITLRRDSSGKAVGFLLISKDISDEIRMSQYARRLIEASLDPLVTTNAGGTIIDANEATATLTGMPRERLIGTDFSQYFTEPENAQEAFRQVFSKNIVTDYPLTVRHVNGRLTDVLYNASIHRDERGNVLGIFSAARDVTGQKLAEAQVAVQRSKELERLAELERFQELVVGRELRMIELKKEIEELKKRAA